MSTPNFLSSWKDLTWFPNQRGFHQHTSFLTNITSFSLHTLASRQLSSFEFRTYFSDDLGLYLEYLKQQWPTSRLQWAFKGFIKGWWTFGWILFPCHPHDLLGPPRISYWVTKHSFHSCAFYITDWHPALGQDPRAASVPWPPVPRVFPPRGRRRVGCSAWIFVRDPLMENLCGVLQGEQGWWAARCSVLPTKLKARSQDAPCWVAWVRVDPSYGGKERDEVLNERVSETDSLIVEISQGKVVCGDTVVSKALVRTLFFYSITLGCTEGLRNLY